MIKKCLQRRPINTEFNATGRIIIKEGFKTFSLLNIFYFPNLIKEVIGGVNLRFAKIKNNIDNLEKIGGFLDCESRKISFKTLKKIEGSLNIKSSDIKSFDVLEEIGSFLNISHTNIKTIEDFLKVFPELKKIGKDKFNTSIWIDSDQEFIKPAIKKLKDERKLEFDGNIDFV